MEQNREVLAVPGNITSKNSFGTNFLIKDGAKLVQQWQDVVSELPPEIAAAILPPKIEKESEETSKQPETVPANLNENERAVLRLLSPDDAAHIDFLLEKSSLSFGDLQSALLALDMKDLIRELAGKRYARKI